MRLDRGHGSPVRTISWAALITLMRFNSQK